MTQVSKEFQKEEHVGSRADVYHRLEPKVIGIKANDHGIFSAVEFLRVA